MYTSHLYTCTYTIDDDSCCQDPLSPDSSDILKGSFTEKLEEVYQMALREELPVSELKVQENIDIKTSMRLVCIECVHMYMYMYIHVYIHCIIIIIIIIIHN